MKRDTIVLLHGWGLSGSRFESLVRELSRRGWRVFAPDFPGFGLSAAPPSPLHLSDYATYLHDYVTKNNVTEPIIIGHSFGGRVALKYQFLHPKSVRALILSGTPGFTPINRKKLLLFILLAKIGKAFFSLPPFHLVQEGVRRWYYYLVGARDYYRAEGVMRETFKYIVQEDLLDCMKAVRVPCLLLWGEKDVIVPLRVAEKMKGVISGAKLEVIQESDHGVPLAQPELFASYVERFIKSL